MMTCEEGGFSIELSCSEYEEMEKRIAELEQENADLWAFVRAWREERRLADGSDDKWLAWVASCKATDAAYEVLRKYETTDEPDGDDFGVCDECGEPLLFSSMVTCTNCVEAHHS